MSLAYQARSELELKAKETEIAAMQQQLAVATAHRQASFPDPSWAHMVHFYLPLVRMHH